MNQPRDAFRRWPTTRRTAIVRMTAFLLGANGCGWSRPSADDVLRIGYQKSGTLSLLRYRGILDKSLEAKNLAIEWTEFPAGPPLLEALHVREIDFGHTGDTPPVFAQATGKHFAYIAASAPSPDGSAVLVPRGSEAKSIADLRGKRIAVTRGSSAHGLLLGALAASRMSMKDIEPVYLVPADARAAFTRNAVDAWVIWDPYFAAVEVRGEARVLCTGEGSASGREFYVAHPRWVARQQQLLDELLEAIEEVGNWASRHRAEVVRLLADALRMDPKVVDRAEQRRGRYGVQPLVETIWQEQQQLADRFHEAGLIPKRISVRDSVPPKNETTINT